MRCGAATPQLFWMVATSAVLLSGCPEDESDGAGTRREADALVATVVNALLDGLATRR